MYNKLATTVYENSILLIDNSATCVHLCRNDLIDAGHRAGIPSTRYLKVPAFETLKYVLERSLFSFYHHHRRVQSPPLSSTTMGLCHESAPFDFQDACIRGTWAAILPAVLVLLFSLFSLSVKPPALVRAASEPFKTFITLHEAEALDLAEENETLQVPVTIPVWRTVVFALLGLLEALCWIGYGSYRAITSPEDVWDVVRPFLVSSTWLYMVARPIIKPTPTPPYDLFSLYLVHFATGVLMVGGFVYDYAVRQMPFPPKLFAAALYANLGIAALGLVVIMGMPIDVPSTFVKKEDIVRLISGNPSCHAFDQ